MYSTALSGRVLHANACPRASTHSACSSRTAINLRRRQVCKAQQHTSSTEQQPKLDWETQLLSTAGLLAPLLLASPALAETAPGEHLTKGTLVSLIHPATMIILFGSTLWAGFLGWQWRRTRTVPDEIKELKKQLPPAGEDGKRPPSPLDAKIAELEEERKVLGKGNWKGRHHNWGGLILGLGTLIAVVGPANTYLRTGKLFPGPHLYAGAAVVCLWAGAASMVPLMAKGNDTARTAHIAMNVTNLCLFAWQIPTGLEIVGKVLQFTSLP